MWGVQDYRVIAVLLHSFKRGCFYILLDFAPPESRVSEIYPPCVAPLDFFFVYFGREIYGKWDRLRWPKLHIASRSCQERTV